MKHNKIKVSAADGLGALSSKSYLLDMPNEELLQVIMPKEAAVQLIREYHSIYDVVMKTTANELKTLKGVGNATIYKIDCIREIVRRFQSEHASGVVLVRTPNDIFIYMAEMQYLDQEQFRIILLTTKNKIIGQTTITQGTVNMTPVTPREIFHAAIKNMAACIILVHNHPSGDSQPSEEDINVTKSIVKVGALMGISVLDHIIIGNQEYYSFKEKGYI
ncbi:DNA repair protein RadC [Sporomusa aerivorans]|uniref:RadC family protein n=1 Tax=Sporomusa aerivorans TaxID=204936 RepID=UPI00352AFE53